MGTSLIPIKGISQAQKKNLGNYCKIYDIAGLIANGKTPQQRQGIANKLKIDRRHVDIWVKQADLWRVQGMTEDYAYLLVLAGIRCVEDLSKINVETTKGVLKSISNTHPDFIYDETRLSELKNNAIKITPSSNAIFNLANIVDDVPNNLYELLKDKLSENQIDVSDEEEPRHLFGVDYVLEVLNQKSESEIIEQGLDSLREINISLPLPKYLSGKVTYRSMNASDTRESVCVVNLLVEVKGIICPDIDSNDNRDFLTAYTDSEGVFIITLPDKYSMQECISFTFSQGGYKQSFNIQSSDIIKNSVISNASINMSSFELMAKFAELDKFNNDLNTANFKYKVAQLIEKMEVDKDTYSDMTDVIKRLKDRIGVSNEKISQVVTQFETDQKKCEQNIKKLVINVFGTYPFKADECTVSNLMSLIEMSWNYGINDKDGEGFVLIEEIFKGYKDDYAKALPSVKLMGEDENAVWLPTDKAPSRTYSYSLLQRLVEPSIDPPAGNRFNNTVEQRKKLSKPVDISDFRTKFCENPDVYPKMSSLGMGYCLNMHQAWVPDGFALGELLYSLILAPGEEQRLVVRENNSSYDISDNASAQDFTSQSQSQEQSDNIQALYSYVLAQEMEASSESNFKSSAWSVGGSLSGTYNGITGGLTGGYSRSSGKASSHARQTNDHNEASQASQAFNQKFAAAANMLAQAKRISVRSATSDERDSVATKIIANHNHSHAMTIQYWEVVRRYRLETSIESIDLVLFVPLKPIRFLPNGQNYALIKDTIADGNIQTLTTLKKSEFNERYKEVSFHYNAIRNAIPYKYRNGLDLIQKYYATPYWEIDTLEIGDDSKNETYSITIKGGFCEFDDLTATLFFNNGTKPINGHIGSISKTKLKRNDGKNPHTRNEVREAILNARNGQSSLTYDFTLPYGCTKDNISKIGIRNNIGSWQYTLSQSKDDMLDSEKEAVTHYEEYKVYYARDTEWSDTDRAAIRHYSESLPECYKSPIVTFYADELYSIGNLKITVTHSGESSTIINNVTLEKAMVYGTIGDGFPRLSFSDMQKMEESFQHIVSNTLLYSKAIWRSLSTDELAMMLEQFTIDMDFDRYFELDEDEAINIPLLNCVNVKKPLGFYGNCILFPFTYPEKLAQILGKTAAEIQDSLYRYHASCFRSPSTVISVPTEGMIGEAVLSATNVSEKIDLTRFWNWKDSPIDSMTLDSSYLNGHDYLADKDTKDISALNLQTANLASPVTAADLVSALVAKETPKFDNLTGLEQTATLLGKALESTAQGRDNVINKSSSLADKAMEYATEKLKAESKERLAKISNKSNEDEDDSSAGGGEDDNGDLHAGGGEDDDDYHAGGGEDYDDYHAGGGEDDEDDSSADGDVEETLSLSDDKIAALSEIFSAFSDII
ncbi:DUF4332 domain-containing protein [Ruminococcus sp.]|uniref:DUF4332 domain-containing protein n=1 Tax=Ruminococcus sp. TaxID=41978 RepID=UPI0025DFBC00|nr:DUF4332 domain-containing protein [Ruminococcus sp.]